MAPRRRSPAPGITISSSSFERGRSEPQRQPVMMGQSRGAAGEHKSGEQEDNHPAGGMFRLCGSAGDQRSENQSAHQAADMASIVNAAAAEKASQKEIENGEYNQTAQRSADCDSRQ